MFTLTIKKVRDRYFNDSEIIDEKEFYCERDAIEYLDNNYGTGFRAIAFGNKAWFTNSKAGLTAKLICD